MKLFITITFLFFHLISFSQKSILFLYDDTFIGKSLELGLSEKISNKVSFDYGLRFHINEYPLYDDGNLFKNTMHANDLINHFGGFLALKIYPNIKNFNSLPYFGIKTQIGIMSRKFVLGSNLNAVLVSEVEKKMKRIENQIIFGSDFNVIKNIYFTIYGGYGIGLILDIEADLSSGQSKDYEFSSSFGIGLNLKL